jgi:hypothetical protein
VSPAPRPSPLPSALRELEVVENERNLFCPNYDACLDEVVKQAWDGWTCRHCAFRTSRVGIPQAREYAVARTGGGFEAP